jgi:hypothetical protein
MMYYRRIARIWRWIALAFGPVTLALVIMSFIAQAKMVCPAEVLNTEPVTDYGALGFGVIFLSVFSIGSFDYIGSKSLSDEVDKALSSDATIISPYLGVTDVHLVLYGGVLLFCIITLLGPAIAFGMLWNLVTHCKFQ